MMSGETILLPYHILTQIELVFQLHYQELFPQTYVKKGLEM
jgi:hypothetical protein